MLGKVKTRGFRELVNRYHKSAVIMLRQKVAPDVVIYQTGLLLDKKQTTGKPMPEKAESTKRAYRRKGYDTEHFFVRTGNSSQIHLKNITNGARLHLQNPKIIGYNMPSRARWFTVNPKTRNIISKQLNRLMLKQFNRRGAI